MRGISLRRLMAWVAVLGGGFAALRDSREYTASLVVTVVLAWLTIRTIGFVYQAGPARAEGFGFCLAGWVYFLATFSSLGTQAIEPNLATTKLLRFISEGATNQRRTVSVIVTSQREILRLQDALDRTLADHKNAEDRLGPEHPYSLRLRQQANALRADIDLNASRAPVVTPSNWFLAFPGAVSYEPFSRIGHAMFAIVSALTGQSLALRAQRGRERRTRTDVEGFMDRAPDDPAH